MFLKGTKSTRVVHQGFTLVEMLAVVSIIMILLMLMVPSMLSARDKAYGVLCASNLRSIGVAAQLYAGEHNDCFPCADNFASASDSWYQWTVPNSLERGTLFPYLGQTSRAFLCPIFARVYRLNPDLTHLTAHMNYVMNHSYASWGWQGYVLKTRQDATEPSELGLFTEENPYLTKHNIFIVNDLRIAVGNYGDPNHVWDGIASYHNPIGGDLGNGYGHVCFADGHVQLVHHSRSKEVFVPEIIKRKYRR